MGSAEGHGGHWGGAKASPKEDNGCPPVFVCEALRNVHHPRPPARPALGMPAPRAHIVSFPTFPLPSPQHTQWLPSSRSYSLLLPPCAPPPVPSKLRDAKK